MPSLTSAVHESGKVMGQNFNLPSIELQTAVIEAAHNHGLITAAHALTLEDTLAILGAGVDGLAHTFVDTPPTPELIQAYKANNSFCIPTLSVHGSLTGEGAPIAASFANDPRAQGKIDDAGIATMCACIHVGAQTCRVENAYESVRQLKAAGIDILLYVTLFLPSFLPSFHPSSATTPLSPPPNQNHPSIN